MKIIGILKKYLMQKIQSEKFLKKGGDGYYSFTKPIFASNSFRSILWR